MDNLTHWAAGVCITCIVLGSVKMLFPDSKQSNMIRFSIKVVLLVSLIFPLFDININSLTQNSTNEHVELTFQNTDQLIIAEAASLIQKQVETLLDTNKIPYTNVSINLHMGEDLRIDYVKAFVNSSADSDTVENLIESEMNISAEITNETNSDF